MQTIRAGDNWKLLVACREHLVSKSEISELCRRAGLPPAFELLALDFWMNG